MGGAVLGGVSFRGFLSPLDAASVLGPGQP